MNYNDYEVDDDEPYDMMKDPDFRNKMKIESNAPKMAEIERIQKAGIKAVNDVLFTPKNFIKPPFPKNLKILFNLAFVEMMELSAELDPINIDYRKARAEAADTMAYLCAFVAECDEQIKAGK